MMKRIVIRIAIAITLFAIAIFFILRSCLSKFDERAAIGGDASSQSASQFLVFEKEGKGVVFSLVKYEQAISYSKKGGITQKSVNNSFYIQTNDLYTASKTGSQKIKKHGEVKTYPVEIIGPAGDKAWIFAGELLAFDPFTLTKLADAGIVEEKNPSLKGRLINERRYYSLDNETHQLIITAADGARYNLNTATLLASAIDENTPATTTTRVNQLDKQIAAIRTQSNLGYDRLRKNNQFYKDKQLSINDYKDSSANIRKETSQLDKQLDSLNLLLKQARDEQRNSDEQNNRKEKAANIGSSFNSIKVNCDTLLGRWYGLFTNEELANTGKQFTYRSVNDETARNKLFTTGIDLQGNNWVLGEEKIRSGDGVYLQGGFLLDRTSGTPYHVKNNFLIVYKDRIGTEGLVQLARINTNGQQAWTINTGLKSLNECQQRGNQLVVTGNDNAELSSGQVNVLQVINLATGAIAVYDFFTDKLRVFK